MLKANRFCMLAVTAALAVAGGTASFAATSNFFFRPGASLIDISDRQSGVTIKLEVPSPYGLTVGEAVSIPLEVTGDATGVTYAPAGSASMPGLYVDEATGEVWGTPSAPAGTSYTIAVVASRDGQAAAQTAFLHKTLREPLTMTSAPGDIRFIYGDSFPETSVSATVTGGEQGSIEWTLANGPDWLEAVESGPAQVLLQVKGGHDVSVTDSTQVTLATVDAEGRRAEHSFELAVMPGPEILVPSTSADGFGIASSIYGNSAVVGAYTANTVFVFQKQEDDTWLEVQKLTGTGWYGYAVAITGDTLVVGANHAGYANVYRKQADGTYSLLQTLTQAGSSRFGYSVATDGQTVVIGAFASNTAYVYEIQPDGTLAYIQTLSGSGSFGDSVAVDGNTIFVGGYNVNGGQGSMTAFTKQGSQWVQATKFTGPGGMGELFGYRVALKGDTAFFSHARKDIGGLDRGSVWVAERQADGSWATVQELTPSNPVNGAAFGGSVAFDGKVAIIGAWSGDHVYAFRKSGGNWYQSSILQFPGSIPYTVAHISVSINDDKAVVSLNGSPTAYVVPTP